MLPNASAGSPKYRAALLDLDDTIFDHQFHRRQALAALRDATALPGSINIEDLERAHDLHLQRTHSAFLAQALTLDEARTERFRGLLSDFGLPAGKADSEAAERTYLAVYGRQWRTVPGARELIERLRALGVVVAVITNGKSVEQAQKLRVLGLHDSVDAVFVSEAVGSEKPARAFFEHVTSRLSIPCAQCVVVGDLWDTDIQGALNSGIDAIWLNRYGRTCPPTPGVREITSLEPTEQVARLFLSSP